MTDTTKQFTITRDLPGSVEEVWAAWTQPELMAQWMAPREIRAPPESVSADVRVGGRYAYTMIHDATNTEYPTGGEFLELDPPRRLVCTWGHPTDQRDDMPRLIVELERIGEDTRMTFTCVGVVAGPGDQNVYDGWSEAFDALERALAGERSTS